MRTNKFQRLMLPDHIVRPGTLSMLGSAASCSITTQSTSMVLHAASSHPCKIDSGRIVPTIVHDPNSEEVEN